jgi:hypothetical protein
MQDVAALTSGEILGYPLFEPERLFPADPDAGKALRRALVKRWHPDLNKDPTARAVFEHIDKLWSEAERRYVDGSWREPGVAVFPAGARKIRIRYVKRHIFELGELFVGSGTLTFAVRREFEDLFRNGVRRLQDCKFADADMRKEIAPRLGQVLKVSEGDDHLFVVLRRENDLVLLKDLITHVGTLPAVHVAWIVNDLMTTMCWLQYAGLTHNAIAPDTILVSPKTHYVSLAGGWWYATSAGTRLQKIPARSYGLAPPDLLTTKRASPALDLELVRSIGRACLGDETGTELIRDTTLPRSLVDWLCIPGGNDAVKEYSRWVTATGKAFGARRFVELPVSFSDVYPNNGE